MERKRFQALYEQYLRKRPKQSRSRSVVEAILAAAAEALSRTDEERMTLEQIARRAGVGIGSLYDYFDDRRSVLGGVAAKITEDNRRELERVLEGGAALPLDDAVRLMIDDLFRRYVSQASLVQSILRIAASMGLLPTLVDSQRLVAQSLATLLRRREDVHVDDVDVTAFVMTNMTMGIIHALVWAESPFEEERLKAEIVRIWVRHLRSGESGAD